MRTSTHIIVSLAGLLIPLGAMAFGPFECREHLFFSEEELPRLRAEVDSWVVLRVLGDCQSERQVTLIKHPSGRVEAHTVRPVKISVTEQLHSLEKEFPKAQTEELCELVELETTVVEEGEQPALGSLLGELEDLKVSPVFEPVLYVHGVRYKLWVGSSIHLAYFQFQGPPFRADERKGNLHPLEVWSQRLLQMVGASCPMTK